MLTVVFLKLTINHIQVIPGSHRAGRIEHKKQGGQMESDPERTQELVKAMGLEHVEMDPG